MKKDFLIIGSSCLLLFTLSSLEPQIKSLAEASMINVLQLPKIQEIDLNFSCRLYIQQGDEQKIAFEGTSSSIAKIRMKVKNGKLILREKKDWMLWKKNVHLPNVYITLKDIRNIEVNNSQQRSTIEMGNRLAMEVGNTGVIILIKT